MIYVRRQVAVLAGLAGLFLGPLVANASTRTLEHQGVDRSFIVVNDAITADGPKPLLIALHGRRDPQAPNTSGPTIDALAAREGFVAIYPAALEGKWNYPG